MSLKQPVSQVRFTNVAFVRFKSHGLRFELACYKNKISEWKNGTERDIDEILQSPHIFLNASKGLIAPAADLTKVFGTSDYHLVATKILDSGQGQSSEQERTLAASSSLRDVAAFIARRCVSPVSHMSLTVAFVQQTLKKIGFSIKPGEAPKKAALRAIDAIIERLPGQLSRAMMVAVVYIQRVQESEIVNFLQTRDGEVISVDPSDNEDITIVVAFHPLIYRSFDVFTKSLLPCVKVSFDTHTGLPPPTADDARPISNQSDDTTPNVPSDKVDDVPADKVDGVPSDKVDGVPSDKGDDIPADCPKIPSAKCSTCSVYFDSSGAFREHRRSPWHTFNSKRTIRGLPVIDQVEFDDLTRDIKDGFLAII